MASELPPESVYAPVFHKKKQGKLCLHGGGLRFETTLPDDPGGAPMAEISWNKVAKHQVSPANFPRALLKILPVEGAGKPLTFQLGDRPGLEKARNEITERIRVSRSETAPVLRQEPPATPSGPANGNGNGNGQSHTTDGPGHGTKRKASGPPSSASSSSGRGSRSNASLLATGNTTAVSYGELDPTSEAVTRSSLLASNPSLRSQHRYLVEESKTVSEEDFWTTHKSLLEEEYARISGITRAGTSSLLQSHLQVLTGRITLGVEEMRQIFILYPAVHKAYEEKVPLELSDEQFWRKYLESEYFHRDRGRVGAASGRLASGQGVPDGVDPKKAKEQADASKDQAARAAVVAADDIFSRYDQKLRESSGKPDEGGFSQGDKGEDPSAPASSSSSSSESQQPASKRRRWGSRLAIGQFDLASTFETERGNLLEGPKDNHPHYDGSASGGTGDEATSTIGAKVIQKYNRHWAMVLNPDEAVAGSNLMEVARHSVRDAIPNDQDAEPGGGWDEEMRRLVGFAEASEEQANHALGIGDSDDYEALTLKNVGAYYNRGDAPSNESCDNQQEQQRAAEAKRCAMFANLMNQRMNKLLEDHRARASSGGRAASSSPSNGSESSSRLGMAFPPPRHGHQLMQALTKRMQLDSRTDADTLEVVNALPVGFKKRLHSYFRRASELLRHFFGLQRLAQETDANGSGGGGADRNAYKQKLEKIKNGLRTLHGDIDAMRNEQEMTSEEGKTMAGMCKQIMDQLNSAFKSSEEATNTGGFVPSGSGGFTTVETF
ncbi:unnamed protein product [Pseudo-nitzschia multistriata]|uniref:BSD domain-containing protein n=1 Tax=Pseudo-nitzschia multistriata TaxID=183589 RepID=A0A448YVL1_9STRA|nr:unnamed protein product [Pseudo-nitzschia multistriata]